jgi:hypothetical protein
VARADVDSRPATPRSIHVALGFLGAALLMPVAAIIRAKLTPEHGFDRLGAFFQMILIGAGFALIGIICTIAGASQRPRSRATQAAIHLSGAFAILGAGIFTFVLYIN